MHVQGKVFERAVYYLHGIRFDMQYLLTALIKVNISWNTSREDYNCTRCFCEFAKREGLKELINVPVTSR